MGFAEGFAPEFSAGLSNRGASRKALSCPSKRETLQSKTECNVINPGSYHYGDKIGDCC